MPILQLHIVKIYFKQKREGLYYNFFLVCFHMSLQVMLRGWFVISLLMADAQREIITFQECLASFSGT